MQDSHIGGEMVGTERHYGIGIKETLPIGIIGVLDIHITERGEWDVTHTIMVLALEDITVVIGMDITMDSIMALIIMELAVILAQS
jgi:hypothetical protein